MDMTWLSPRLIDAIIFFRGEEDGWAWLNALPERIGKYCERWNLTPESIAEDGATSCCVYCSRHDGTLAVLKIPVDVNAGYLEMRSLSRWALADAAPEVLDYAEDSGVYLMTRILPGAHPWPVNGPEDTDCFNELLARLNDPGLPPLENLPPVMAMAEERLVWAEQRFADDTSYSDMTLRLPEARRALEVVCRDKARMTVLHGDLQAKNILLDASGKWIAIDPLTAVGDINYEAALWAVVQQGPISIDDRLTQLAKNQLLEPGRLAAWAFVLGIAEYRRYLPGQAGRIEAYVSGRVAEDLIGLVA